MNPNKTRMSEAIEQKRKVVGAKLKSLREAANVSQATMSRETGLTISTIVNIEHGHRSFRIDNLIQCLEAIGHSLPDVDWVQ